MRILQLNPPMPMDTPKGPGLAWLHTDYGPEYDDVWTVALNETGELWKFNNKEVRAQKNITFGRIPNDKHPRKRN